MSYTKKVKLEDNEQLYKVDCSTGELKEVKSNSSNNLGKTLFNADSRFTKNYDRVWLYLVDNLSLVELKIATKMSIMSEHTTNSLSPLDDKTNIRDLAKYFGIGVNSVRKAFDNLFKLGVYASFEYSHYKRGIVKEWIFNPYISFKGRLIQSDIKELFSNTYIAREFKE